jgi:type I restriction enzyme S subunit
MDGDWIKCTVADACSSIDYGLTASASDNPAGPRFLRITDIVQGHIVWDSVPYVEQNVGTKYRLHDGDIVLARTGASTGASAYVKSPPPAVFASYLVRLQATPEFDARFLAYYLKSNYFLDFIHSILGDKSAQPNASASTMTKAPFCAPKDIKEQRRIAHILGTIDDKIENNRKTAKTLESMAQAIFKSWFVDFDPVRAKMNGESEESICKRLKLTPEILDLFPDRLVDSELGEIPDGWGVAPLSDMYSFQNGYAFKSKDWQDYGVPVIKIGSVKPGLVDLSNVSYVSEEVANQAKEYQLLPADLVIGMTGYVGEVGLVPKASVCPMLNQRVGRIVLDGRGTQHVSFAYCLTRQSAFKNAVEIKAHGTAQANVSSSAIMSINTMAPTDTLRSAFDRLCAIIFDELLTAHETAMILSKLRDTLLPKLISGEIRVPETDKSTQDFRGHHV